MREGAPEWLLSLAWLHELEILLARYQSMGIGPDVASLSLVELWGLYMWLKNLGG